MGARSMAGTSVEGDPDAIAVLVDEVQDGPDDAGGEGFPDPLDVLRGEAGNHPHGGVAEPGPDPRLAILQALERGDIDVDEAGRRLAALEGQP